MVRNRLVWLRYTGTELDRLVVDNVVTTLPVLLYQKSPLIILTKFHKIFQF